MELGCSPSVVRGATVKHGIKIPDRKTYKMTVDKSGAVKRGLARRYGEGRYGPLAANWRGGKQRDSNGYVWIYAPDHPRAKARGRTHMQEHILVMEKKLGRYLEPGERVEHDNGIKHDNRPKNLKLMGSNGEHIKQHFGYGERTRQAEAEAKQLKRENRQLKGTVRRLEQQVRQLGGTPVD
jgi:hypothetical protein